MQIDTFSLVIIVAVGGSFLYAGYSIWRTKKNGIETDAFVTRISDKRMDIHAPVSVDQSGSRMMVGNVFPDGRLSDAHGTVNDDDFHLGAPFHPQYAAASARKCRPSEPPAWAKSVQCVISAFG